MSENPFTGYTDPSIYAVIINAKAAGWVPRPPSIKLDNIQNVVNKLGKTSSHVTENKKLDLRFAASLHERKHFLDLHLSHSLWRSFLSWFHCSSNVFSLITKLKNKNIKLPLYTVDGKLREDIPLNSTEKKYIKKICDPVFTIEIDNALKYAIEVNATILQFSCFTEKYSFNFNEQDSYPKKYLKQYYIKPLEKFENDINKAFSFYNFCSWLCLNYDDISIVEKSFLKKTDLKESVHKLLKKEPFANRMLSDLENDEKYLKQFCLHYQPIDSTASVNMAEVLDKLISFRKTVLLNNDILIELLGNIDFFKRWIADEGMRTPYIVDFGYSLSPDTEITENYLVSKWIIPNDRFLYYNDNIGVQFFELDDLDNLINQQLLSSYLICPYKLFPFKSRICSEKFFEFRFCDERV